MTCQSAKYQNIYLRVCSSYFRNKIIEKLHKVEQVNHTVFSLSSSVLWKEFLKLGGTDILGLGFQL